MYAYILCVYCDILILTKCILSFICCICTYTKLYVIMRIHIYTGESYTAQDDEDMALAEVTGISIAVGRMNIEVTSASAGKRE